MTKFLKKKVLFIFVLISVAVLFLLVKNNLYFKSEILPGVKVSWNTNLEIPASKKKYDTGSFSFKFPSNLEVVEDRSIENFGVEKLISVASASESDVLTFSPEKVDFTIKFLHDEPFPYLVFSCDMFKDLAKFQVKAASSQSFDTELGKIYIYKTGTKDNNKFIYFLSTWPRQLSCSAGESILAHAAIYINDDDILYIRMPVGSNAYGISGQHLKLFESVFDSIQIK